MVEADLGLYDYCALVPVIEGAGGVMSAWSGERLTMERHEASKGRVIAAANAQLHAEALAILAKPAPSAAAAWLRGASGRAAVALLLGVGAGVLLSRRRA